MLLKEDLAILTNVMNESKSKRLGEEDWPSGHLNGQRKRCQTTMIYRWNFKKKWHIIGKYLHLMIIKNHKRNNHILELLKS